MKKFLNKIKEFFMNGCKGTAEAKDVVFLEEEKEYVDVVFIKPLEEDKLSFKVVEDIDILILELQKYKNALQNNDITELQMLLSQGTQIKESLKDKTK